MVQCGVARPAQGQIGGGGIILQREGIQQNRPRAIVKVPEGLGDDRVAARYEQLLKDLDWSQIAEIDDGQARRGRLPHPERTTCARLRIVPNGRVGPSVLALY